MFTILINSVFDALYVSLWICVIGVQFYNELIDPLKNEINDLKVKQDMLYETIIDLKHIISNDKSDTDENKQHIKSIEEEVSNMCINYGKRIYKIEEEVFKNETNTSEEDEEEYETDDSPVPIQNHIKFPHFVMYNDSNYQKPIKNSSLSCRYLKDQIRLLSYELVQFLNIEPGTCMTVEEVYNTMMKYISANCSRNAKSKVINMDSKLRKLFAITENEDYELKSSNLILYLKPHLKVIV
jgi:hypothetical protein